MNKPKNIADTIKNHFFRTGTFLLYTLIFNVVSFVLYFIPAFFTHFTDAFAGFIWFPLGILQVIFTVFFFKNIPLPKLSYDKGTKFDLLLYAVIISVLSIVIVLRRFQTDEWFTYIYFNTFHTLTASKLLNFRGLTIFVSIIENVIKTCCLYKNTKGKSKASDKMISKVSVILIALYFAFVVFLFIITVSRIF